MLPTITLFAFSAMRLMPSANRIMAALTGIKFYSSALDEIYDEFNNIKSSAILPLKVQENKTDSKSFKFTNKIKLTNISYQYPGSNQITLDNISVSISKGDFIGIAGPSGCGKSTLVDIFTGLLKPKCGKIEVDAIQVTADNIKFWQENIGYIPQTVYLLDDSIKNNIAFGQKQIEIDESKIIKALESTDLKQYVDSLEDGIETTIGEQGIKTFRGTKTKVRNCSGIVF